MGRLEENSVPPPSNPHSFQPPPQTPPSSDQTTFQPPSPHGYFQSSDQTPFQPPQLGHPVPPPTDQTTFQPPPPPQPEGYSVPASSDQTPFQPPQSPHHAYLYHEPTKSPQNYPPQQPPAAAYPQQAQSVACPPQQQPPVANGASYNPQIYNYSTPNHNCQPQAAVNYGVPTTGYQLPPVINPAGTPNCYQPPLTQEWSTGLLECFEDPENAIMTFCFPCVTFGQIAEIVDNGQTSCATSGLIYSLIVAFIGIPCIMSCSYRTKVRSRYNLLETPAPDWVIHLFCEYCALCQEYRELKNRGMDPALGWQGNLSKQQQMANYATMTPPTNQRMMG